MTDIADSPSSVAARIADRSARTVVMGLGYVGLPFALLHAQAGFRATGIERNAARVAAINEGRSYIETCADADIAAVVATGHLRATADFAAVAEADVVSICVPTPLSAQRDPDVSFIHHVLNEARPYWHAGQLVILESTTYPGATEEILVPFFRAIGLAPGEDIHVAFAPERIDPGNTTYDTAEIPRIVGGLTPECGAVAQAFYRQLMTAPVTVVSSPRVAEMTKLFENVFRVVNVSLVNELAQLCDRMGIDVWEVIEAAKTKPFGFMPFYPGPGIGGHCIPIDPFYLSWKAREYGFTTRFIELAGEVNEGMPLYVAQRAMELLNESGRAVRGARILLLGMAFKKDVGDTRDSASVHVAERLCQLGAEVAYHDPYVPALTIDGHALTSTALTEAALAGSDLVIITTDHGAVDYDLVARAAPLVYDTRNALQGVTGANIRRLGAPS